MVLYQQGNECFHTVRNYDFFTLVLIHNSFDCTKIKAKIFFIFRIYSHLSRHTLVCPFLVKHLQICLSDIKHSIIQGDVKLLAILFNLDGYNHVRSIPYHSNDSRSRRHNI